MKTFSSTESQDFLQHLHFWKFADNAIERHFEFKNFSESLAFILQVGLLAEKSDHHPEIFNVYNKVNLRLSTHDWNGVTTKDFDLAKKINALFAEDLK